MAESPTSPSRKKTPALPRWLVIFFVGFVLVSAGFLIFLYSLVRTVPVSGNVLVLDLRTAVSERSEFDLVQQLLGGSTLDLVRLRAGLKNAAEDPGVHGIVLRVGAPGMSLGQVGEIRTLLAAFRQRGKFVASVLESADTMGYYLATVANEVYLDRSCTLQLVGLEMQSYFLGEALSSLGLRADLVRIGEYKGAYEHFTRAEASPAYLEAMQSTLDSLFETLVEGIAESRGVEPADVREWIDGGPYTPERALGAGLIDHLVYRDEIKAQIDRLGRIDSRSVPMSAYAEQSGLTTAGAIGLIVVDGMIVEGEGDGVSPLGQLASAERVQQALRQARESEQIEAVVVRVNSPGGTLSASEALWREIKITNAVKPVVVSMSDLAASGGYYIATAARRILAHPGTLTGSIGVFGGKVVIGDLLDRFNVRVVTARRGRKAGMFDLHRSFDDEERQAMRALLRAGYDQFIERVAEGRNKESEAVETMAQGRVWTGKQALDRGLIDQLGGLDSALAEACRLAGISRGSPSAEFVLLPPARTLYELLTRRGARSRYLLDLGRDVGDGARALPALLELARGVSEYGVLDGGHSLAMLPWVVRLR